MDCSSQMLWLVAVLANIGHRIAEENLTRQKIHFYNPKFRKLQIVRGRKRWIEHQLFPGYLFVMPTVSVTTIRSTRGLSDVIRCADRPLFVADDELDICRRRHDSDGFVQMEKPREKFMRGDPVKITDDWSPFFGEELFYDCTSTKDRVRVLMRLMGRMVPITVRENALVAA